MPVPKPTENESQDEFISRCIETLQHEDPDRPDDQISAICYSTWRDSKKNAKSLYDEIVERMEKIKQLLISTFGDRGRALLEYTLMRLGAFDPKLQRMNIAALKGDIKLPFLKYDGDCAIIENLILNETEFTKVDSTNRTVSGYGNTSTCDIYDDIFMPEAYMDSIKEYDKPVFFMHHTDIPAGKILERKIDEIGWFVRTKPDDAFWSLFEKKTLRGFSVGGEIKIWPDVVGQTYVSYKRYSIKVDDLSYVTRPANKLSYYAEENLNETEKQNIKDFVQNANKPMKLKSQSLQMTVRHDDTVANKEKEKNKEENKMSEKETQTEETTLTNEQLMSMSPKELAEHMKKQAEQELKANLITQIREQEKTLKEAKDEDRLKEVFNKIGTLTAKIDDLATQVASVVGKIAVAETRIQKMEDEPDLKAVIPPENEEESLEAVAKKSVTFGEYMQKAEKLKEGAT